MSILKSLSARKFVIAGLFIFAMLSALMVWSGEAFAKDQRNELREKFLKAVQGKTVAWSPCWLGVLETEWTNIMRANFERYGIKFIVRGRQF